MKSITCTKYPDQMSGVIETAKGKSEYSDEGSTPAVSFNKIKVDESGINEISGKVGSVLQVGVLSDYLKW